MINNFGFIGAPTSRSDIYLNIFKSSKLKPRLIILYSQSFDKKTYDKFINIFDEIIFVKSKSASSNKIKKEIEKSETNLFIYSGNPGEILNIQLFNKLKINFLHSHSGKLPEFKGSTTIYYSILSMKKIYCSTFIMNEKIDKGEIILVSEYPIPKKIKTIESDYDNKIRALNIVKVLKNNNKLKGIKKNYEKKYFRDTYFIAHPLIRSLVINKKRPL